MNNLRKSLLILFALFALGYGAWAQPWYINHLMLLGDYDDIVDNNIDIYEKEGWTLVDYNLNKGAGGQSIYLLYQTTYNNVTIPAITDFYIKSTSDKHDHPDQITYNNRTYHRITAVVGSESFMDSYGDLNDGAGGKYIYLYYTIDAWDYPRGITSIEFNDDSFGAVCGNGSTTPQDVNQGAGGEYIYMHYGYTLMTDVVDVDDQYDFAPLNAHSDKPLYFRLSDNAVNGSVVTVSTINVGNNNTAVIDLNGKAFSRLIQSGGSGENGHVIKVTDNSTLTIVDGSLQGIGSISGGDADKGGAVYVEAGSTLNIESGTIEYCKAEDGGAIYNLGTLTIDGGTIQNCTTTSGWGHGTIYNNGIMTINNGIIQNNTANYGGAIYNVNSWRVTINGGAIQNNHATLRGYDDDGIGGGIVNNGLLYINGGSIVGNTCDREGGGIWMKDEGGIFMKGDPVIKNNTKNSINNNVYVPDNKVINVVDSFTVGASIGVTPQTVDNRMTDDYSVHNNGIDPASFFFSDNGYFIKLDNGEVKQDPSISVVEAYYIDADSNEAYYSNCFLLSSINDENGVTLNSGWYLLDANKTFSNRINVNGDVNIILGDGYELYAQSGIEMMNDANSLTVYCQSGHTGRLVSYGEIGNAGKGTITINGGYVTTNHGINANAINLNWTDYSATTVEHIAAIYYNGTVTLQKYFIDADETVYNPGVVTDNSMLGNKMLKPYPVFAVNIGTIEDGSFTASPDIQHDGLTVTLTGTPADAGHPLCSKITVTGATTGKDVTVTRVGTSNDFTFVMPAEAVNVTAKFEDKVLADYVSLFGELRTVPAIAISGGGNLTLDNGWYVVNNDVDSSTGLKNITINGDNVNIILCDNKTLNLNDGTASYITFAADNYQLIVWGQSAGTGLLRVANTSGVIPIGHYEHTCNISLNGGRVETIDSNTQLGGYSANVFLRGAKVSASGYKGDIIFKRFYEDANGIKYYEKYWTPEDLAAMSGKLLFPCDKVFVKKGDWNVADNWLDKSIPGSNDYVTLRRKVAIPNGYLAQAKDIMEAAGGSIAIKDGGQLYVNPGRSMELPVTVEKNISAADGAAQTNWYLLSSPVYNDYYYDDYTDANYNFAFIATVDNLTKGSYDMFRYDEPNHKWQNKKAHGAAGFQLMERGRGFLYRNAADQKIAYTGIISYGYLNNKNYLLSYTDITGDYAALKGFNLIGNPYTHNIKKGNAADASISNTYLETGFYKLSNNGQWAACTDDETIIGVGEAILVQATSEANRRCTTFSDVLPSAGKNRDNNDNIMFTVANSQYSDVTYALFEEGHGLTKIDHRNAEVPMLYIPKNGENLAIATMSDNTKVFPLNFKAMTMGNYTVRCNAEGDFSYLHLFDKLTGEDVDLLLEKEYSFIGVPSDRDDRFVVSLEYYDNSEFSDNFAYQNGTDVIVSGAGTLQVFDVMGRMVADQRINGVQSITMPQGVYIFRLEGKTQKIVIR